MSVGSIKLRKRMVYEGFGFPVILENVPTIKIRGEDVPKVNFNELSKVVLLALVHKPVKLTGDEICFIRQYFELTLVEFAERFAVSHPGVLNWERYGDSPTNMNWTTEKDIRLFILNQLQPKKLSRFVESYKKLQKEAAARKTPLKINISKEKLAA